MRPTVAPRESTTARASASSTARTRHPNRAKPRRSPKALLGRYRAPRTVFGRVVVVDVQVAAARELDVHPAVPAQRDSM